ncbi:MAG: serine--tRNA ligase [Bacilli bacterium]|jgi:seryl-tRNA synthetase
MLDIKRIVENKEEVRKALLKRGLEVDFDLLINLYNDRRQILVEVEELKSIKNKLTKEVGILKRKKESADHLIKEMTNNNEKIDDLEKKQKDLAIKINDFLIELPNTPDDDVVSGGKEFNEVIRTYKEKPEFTFESKDHVTLINQLGLVDFERGTKLGGFGYWIYKGIGARLEWALINYFIDFHLKNGYEFLLPPHILNEECGYTAGQFPKFKDDVFKVLDGGFLLPTAETAIINYHRDEILNINDLPKKYFSYTPCYRKEAGSHRAEERGTVRGHQFNKVEMFVYTTKEDSEKMLEELVLNAEKLVQGLNLHYQVSKLAAEDVSAGMAKTYDVEIWIPSMKEYKEVSSVSNARDYQTRRGMIRYKTKEGKIEYAHALNGSGLATSRLLPALIEQNQNEDGSITIPEVLRPYLGGISKITVS